MYVFTANSRQSAIAITDAKNQSTPAQKGLRVVARV
jgi:hypothetical protein